ncbi:HD domain-containing protein [Morganella morganii]|uniref:HD domain-containing protein n=5 Tax=Morganella morganii TaxID=582 RepID=UPI003EBAC912
MSLITPDYFKKKLEENAKKNALVTGIVSVVTPWIKPNNMYFFPEYTEHGFTHLNEVLLSSSGLITDEARKILTSEDIAATIISTILHDCAMHLTPDSFYCLISDKYPRTESRFVDEEESWTNMWLSFIDEAKKFNSKQLESIFGDTTPVREIPDNKLDLTDRDKLLIGEFIRRNHARIAHDIAINGIPGVDGDIVRLTTAKTENHFMDLCGFIARSHNMGLRQAVDRLEDAKKRQHLGVKTPFIMLVLRIADYIQIHAERADKELLQIKHIISPISRGEWKKHEAIIEIIHAHQDPEAIFIDAEPQDAKIYVGLKKLFQDIQNELDQCWSVLGEIYGRYKEFSSLGINIRRIRSSLDDEKKYIKVKKPGFIPKILSFRTASSEMMELLIAPLYGDNPYIGIRELLQNSVDACKEYQDFQKNFSHLNYRENTEPDIKIILTINKNGKGHLEIIDHGIGMTLDTINEYFLNIGASFRNSDLWRKNHVKDGHSTVHRTGRFGIGLLAAYLLGDTLQVTTRHITQPSNKGLLFKCTRGDTEIIVTHTNADIGTRISVEIDEETVSKLNRNRGGWDWYVHTDLKIERIIVQKNKTATLPQKYILPSCNSTLTDDWYRTRHQDFDDIIWKHPKIENRRPPRSKLFCNGIIISENADILLNEKIGKYNLFQYNTPDIVIFDQDSKLPLNLERTALNKKEPPFKNEIMIDISEKTVSSILSAFNLYEKKPTIDLMHDLINFNIQELEVIFEYSNLKISRFMLSNEKTIPLDIKLLSLEKPRKVLVNFIYEDDSYIGDITSIKESYDYILPTCIKNNSKSQLSSWVRDIFELNSYSYMKRTGLPIVGRRILISKKEVERLVSPSYVPKTFWRTLNKEWEDNEWIMYSIGNIDKFEGDIAAIVAHFKKNGEIMFVQYNLDWDTIDTTENEGNYFADAWLKLIKKPFISII